MGKTKITIELESDVIDKIKDLLNKYNDNPMFTTKFADIESYLSYVITSQIRNGDKLSQKLEEGLKQLSEKLGSFDLGDMDLSKIFGDIGGKKDQEPKKDGMPDKKIKN